MSDPDESSVFESFLSYDFNKDINFQNGWKQILSKISQEEIPTQLQRAKLFYYNKNVAPIHGDHFKEWMKVKEISNQLATRSKGVEYSDQQQIQEEELDENKMVRKKDINSVNNTFEKYETLNLCIPEKGKNLENSINVSGNGDQDKNIQQVSDIDKDENICKDVIVMGTSTVVNKNNENLRECFPDKDEVSDIDKDTKSCKDSIVMGTSTVVIENKENLIECFPDKDEKKCSDGVASTKQISERLNLEDVDSSSREKLGKESSEIFEDEIKLSFGEIVTLIQSGEVIPGLKSVDVKPSNTLPSPSLLPQVRKPWQTD